MVPPCAYVRVTAIFAYASPYKERVHRAEEKERRSITFPNHKGNTKNIQNEIETKKPKYNRERKCCLRYGEKQGEKGRGNPKINR